MSDTSPTLLHEFISNERVNEIDQWIAKYPASQKQSAVMSALRIVQDVHGFLTQPMMDAVASYLEMPPIAVYEVATFYSMYELSPTGRHIVNVCTNISCKLRGADAVVQHLEQKWGIKVGETTNDGRFTLRTVECLAACANAPAMQIDKTYHEDLTPSKIDAVLEHYQ